MKGESNMKTKRFFVSIALVIGLTLVAVIVVSASNLAVKPFAEGEGALRTGGQTRGDSPDKPYPEGEGALSVGSLVGTGASDRATLEGRVGKTGTGSLAAENAKIASDTSTLSVLYQFTGVADDGEMGSSARKKATSIHCTNVDATDVQVEVQIYQWNGTEVYTGTLVMPPNRTSTFSTQNTFIYYDDVFIGGGTPAIFQGSGQIYASSPKVVCTVQVLDPLNYPPTFVTKLPMFDPYGRLIKRTPPPFDVFLPLVMR
jgi:hypothetical protein